MTFEQEKNLVKEAKAIGAIGYRIYSVDYMGHRNLPFSYHFFNENDDEVCMYILDMVTINGMHVFETPRVWSNEFKNNTSYTKLIKF
jgi:hypothetical protein